MGCRFCRMKDFFKKLKSVYKTVADRSGGCGYMPPDILRTPENRKTVRHDPENTDNKGS